MTLFSSRTHCDELRPDIEATNARNTRNERIQEDTSPFHFVFGAIYLGFRRAAAALTSRFVRTYYQEMMPKTGLTGPFPETKGHE